MRRQIAFLPIHKPCGNIVNQAVFAGSPDQTATAQCIDAVGGRHIMLKPALDHFPRQLESEFKALDARIAQIFIVRCTCCTRKTSFERVQCFSSGVMSSMTVSAFFADGQLNDDDILSAEVKSIIGSGTTGTARGLVLPVAPASVPGATFNATGLV
jgi:hypothetical protein